MACRLLGTKGPINNEAALFQLMAWYRTGNIISTNDDTV